MKLKTFHKGGVHPAENKLSANSPIEVLPIPNTISIPICQHLGAPAKVIVKKGDAVKVGTLIAEAAGFISANVHSSVSGKVFKIEQVMETSGYKKDVVTITVEGDEWEESINRTPDLEKEITLSKEEIVERVKQMGIVGLGGATFPSYVKLMVPPGKTAEVLLINAVECEPYLTSDHRVMLEHADEIMVGIAIVMKSIGVSKTIIGIENNKKDAIAHLAKVSTAYRGIEIAPLKVLYPQGGEKQLIKSVLGKEVPSGALPIEVGAVVLNVGTIFSIYQAVQKNKPLIERVVTITGKTVKNPANYLVRVGTPVKVLLEKANSNEDIEIGKIISGGPMMGKALSTADVPITKGTSGILLMKKSESKRNTERPCIKCARCISVCPMGLGPYLISALGKRHLFDQLEKEGIMDCIECGSCSYVCPASKPLLDYIRVGKTETGNIIRSRNK